MTPEEHKALGLRIRRRLLGLIEECRQTLVDIASVNDNHPAFREGGTEPPLDMEFWRILKQKAEVALEAWDRGDSTGPAHAALADYCALVNCEP